MKCANCPDDALYEYRITSKSSVFYCNKDLPKFLKDRKTSNLLPVTQKHEEEFKEAMSKLTTDTDASAEPEESSDEDKPVKKATKKKAK